MGVAPCKGQAGGRQSQPASWAADAPDQFGPGIARIFRQEGGGRLHPALARALQPSQWGLSQWAIVAIVSSLAWDDSLVTPLRSLGRPENVGTRSPVLGFY